MIKNCKDIKLYCDEYIKGDISLNISLNIDKHLKNCEDCRKYYETQEKMDSFILNNSNIAEFESISDNIITKIESSKTVFPMWIVSTAMTCIILFFFAFSYYNNNSLPISKQTVSSLDKVKIEVLEPGALLYAPINEDNNDDDDEFGDI